MVPRAPSAQHAFICRRAMSRRKARRSPRRWISSTMVFWRRWISTRVARSPSVWGRSTIMWDGYCLPPTCTTIRRASIRPKTCSAISPRRGMRSERMEPESDMGATPASTVLEGYAQLRRQIAIMLELARAAEWDALLERQSGYLELGDRVRLLDGQGELDQQAAQRKAELLEAILTDDLAIRELLLARREELGQLMESSRRQRALNRSYGKQADNGHPLMPETP